MLDVFSKMKKRTRPVDELIYADDFESSPDYVDMFDHASTPKTTSSDVPDHVLAQQILPRVLDSTTAFRCQMARHPLPPRLDLVHYPGDRYRGLAVEFGFPREMFDHIEMMHNRLHLGAVLGRLRLAQVFRVVGADGFVLRIWELNNDKGEGNKKSWQWRSVCELTELKPATQCTKWIYFFSFDADDGDTVFLCCDNDIYRYSIERGVYEKVFKLFSTKGENDESFQKSLPMYAHATTVRFPLWPTSLPVLPSP